MRRRLTALAALCGAALFGPTAIAPARADVTPSPSASVDTSTLLEPTSDSALLNLLGQQGVAYYPARRIDDVLAYADPDTTLVISDDEHPDQSTLDQLSSGGFGRVIILNADAATVATFMPQVSVGEYVTATAPVAPSCTQSDAVAAGNVDLDTASSTFTLGAANLGDVGCYPVDGASTMVYSSDGEADVFALGSTTFFENDRLASAGNAALALRLFGAHPKLVWFAPSFIPDPSLNNCGGATCGGGAGTPQPGSTTTIPAGGGGGGGGSSANQPTLTSLMPTWIWWALLQLLVAVLLTAYWRGRRLGAVVTEQLPVTVRAAETVEGHARLYRRADAHGRAAELLRKATAGRLAGYFGVPAARAHADPSVLVTAVATRLRVSEDLVADLLAGQSPQSEAELVLLADHLDQLEQEVRSS